MKLEALHSGAERSGLFLWFEGFYDFRPGFRGLLQVTEPVGGDGCGFGGPSCGGFEAISADEPGLYHVGFYLQPQVAFRTTTCGDDTLRGPVG